MRRPAAAALAVTIVVLVGGCAPAPADPLDDALRAGIRQARADSAWQMVEGTLPTSPRPKVTVGPVLSSFDWLPAIVQCFRDRGFTVTADSGGGYSFSSSQGASQLSYELTSYECSTQHPSVDEVAVSLDRFQLGNLYDYYTRFVQPCLGFAGAPTDTPPERALWVEQYFGSVWHPYEAVLAESPANTRAGRARLDSLEQRCPPVPPWLHL